MRKLRLREVKGLVLNYLARDRKWKPGVHELKAMYPLIPLENVSAVDSLSPPAKI